MDNENDRLISVDAFMGMGGNRRLALSKRMFAPQGPIEEALTSYDAPTEGYDPEAPAHVRAKDIFFQ